MCERAGREKEAIKPWSASFPSLRHISFLTGLFLHTEQGAAALGGGWWKGPPEQTQCGTRQPGWPGPARFMALSHSFPTVRPLSGASGCIIPSLLLFVTSVYLSFLSLSCSTFPIPSFFLMPVVYLCHSSFSQSWYLPPPFSFSPRHPGQLLTQTGCLQLSM